MWIYVLTEGSVTRAQCLLIINHLYKVNMSLLNALLSEAIVHLVCSPILPAAYEIEKFGCARDVL
jgi:hypothetical protein